MDSKHCDGCNLTKATSEFYVSYTRKDGSVVYHRFCKSCRKLVRELAAQHQKESEEDYRNGVELG